MQSRREGDRSAESSPIALSVRSTEMQAEQHLYARLLGILIRIGLVLMPCAFALYYFGIVPARIPPEQLPALWSLPVDEYLRRTATPEGWGWLRLLPAGDLVNLAVLAGLAGTSIPCLLALIPTYLGRRDTAYVLLALAEILVIVLAATNWVSAGH